MNIYYLYNPFIRIAGLKSLLIGISILFLTSYLAFITGTHFNGLSDFEFAKDSTYLTFLTENLLNWFFISVFLYLSGLILSKSKIRAIDILGTTALARIPLIIAPLFRLLPPFQSFISQSWEIVFITGIFWLSSLWCTVLLFNGFKISCNLKNERLIVSFIISIILSEIVTRLLLILITLKL